MNGMVIGVDPDSSAHGVAIYIDGNLIELRKMTLMEMMGYILEMRSVHDIAVCVENVLATNVIYERNEQSNKSKTAHIGNSVGRCQQSCIELLRMFDYCEIPYQLVKPTSGNWAKNKTMFQRVTGWRGKSNADTRSAAFFGFMLAGTNKRRASKG